MPARKVSELNAEMLQARPTIAVVQAESADVEEGRQDVEHPVELQDQRRRAEELDECRGRDRARAPAARAAARPAASPPGIASAMVTTVSTTVTPAPCSSSREVVRDDRPIEGHDEPRCGKAAVDPVDPAGDRVAQQK